MSILEQAVKPKTRACICTILGNAGTGKTSLAATFPNPVVIRVEDGVQGVPSAFRPNALPVVKTVDMLWEQLTALINEEHKFETVIIDSVTQLETLFVTEIIRSDPKMPKGINQALGGYGNGWLAVAAFNNRVRAAAQKLNDKGIHVVFIAHADTVLVEPPDGESYTMYDLRLNKKSVAPYTDNVDLIGYLKLQTFVKEDGKAISDGQRVLVCVPSPNCISKNRYGITKDLPVELGVNPLAPYIETLQTKGNK